MAYCEHFFKLQRTWCLLFFALATCDYFKVYTYGQSSQSSFSSYHEALKGYWDHNGDIDEECHAFFTQYRTSAENFTICELEFANPFRVCTGCIVPYAVLDALFQDFMSNPKLEKCRKKYLSDRVQVMPTLHKSIQDLWEVAECSDCSENVQVDPVTGLVNYSIPESLSVFLDLHVNLTDCIGMNLTLINPLGGSVPLGMVDNISELCFTCKHQYKALNDHYNSLSNSKGGFLCMDMVDMMNHTRFVWSEKLSCSHRSGDPVAVILITLIVGTSPLGFYITLRFTGKEKTKKMLIQKRLAYSTDISSSMSRSFAADGGASDTQRLTHVAS